jgi:potassium-dependent mechanosensitive channel
MHVPHSISPLSKYLRSAMSLQLISAGVMLLFSSLVLAQENKVVPTGNHTETTSDQIQAKIDAVKAKQGMDEAIKTQLVNLYQSIRDNLNITQAYNAKVTEFEDALRQGPEKIKKLQLEFEQSQQKFAKQKPEDFARIGNQELEQRLLIEKNKATQINDQIDKLEKQLAEENNRPDSIRSDVTSARQNLQTAQKKQDKQIVGFDDPQAQEAYLRSTIDRYSTELKMLSVEANSFQVRTDLLKAELKRLNQLKSRQDPVVSAIEGLIDTRRQQEAAHMQRQLSEAEKAVAGKPQVIQNVSRDNLNYSRDLQDINGKIKLYGELKTRIDAAASSIEADFKSAEKKINLAGVSPVLGKILRKQRRNLLTADQFATQSKEVQSEIALASLELFKIEDQLKLLGNLDDYLTSVMQQIPTDAGNDERMMIQAELRVLYNSQEDLLNRLAAAYSTYLRTLGDYDFSRQQMLNQADGFAHYLDERLLWVPSSEALNSHFFIELFRGIRWFISPHNWIMLGKDTLNIVWQNLFLTFLTLLATAAFPVSRKWAKQELNHIAALVDKIQTDQFSHTIKALLYTVILTLPLPLLSYYLGWFLTISSVASGFSKAVGTGLQIASVPLFAVQLIYRIFSTKGIAVRHFHWQESNAALIKNQAAWLRYVVFAGSFIIGMCNTANSGIYSDTLGRLALIGLLIAMALFFSKLLNPNAGLLQSYFTNNPGDWTAKSRYLWYCLIVASPIIIIGFAIEGYYLSALELQQKLAITVRLIFLLIVVHELVLRWLSLVNRRVALKNARQKRKAAAVSEKTAPEENFGGDDPALPIDEELIDIPATNAQTIKLLQGLIGFSLIVGVWIIWKNILPAFSILDRNVLWQSVVMQDNQQILQPVTLTNLIMAGLFGFIMVITVRNFPGVMDLLLFSRMSIAAGGRYAINQLAKYLVISIGLILIANELGGNWSQVQWLVAALGVGLGFGLQEIFANLVSGIILLFERPIRVGDTVTISNVTGKVSRIQMRATTVLDPDQKELIVPNKTFITTQFVNWTLSNSTSRIVIPVVIAEGCDVDTAHKVMTDAVKATPQILAEPAPSVVFTGFSERGLEFSIRVFVGELSNRLPVTHNLHMLLEKMLRDNGIEMSFTVHASAIATTK